MKIDFICNDGSPMHIVWSDIFGRGVGGAELSLLSFAEALAKDGHQVRIYNDPPRERKEVGIGFKNRGSFVKEEDRDVLVVFRSPNPLLHDAKAHRKIWWSTDQYTVGSFKRLSELVDFCVTISPFHTEYHKTRYSIPDYKIGCIDLGVRDEYDQKIEKIEGRLLFCSVPDRGLNVLHAAWPLIKRGAPGASLAITSDYRLWGLHTPNNHRHRLMWAGMPDIHFVGRVERAELVKIQLESEIQAYPCTYEELFCISSAECQVAGALPVTSTFGALPSTNEFGIMIPGDPITPGFVDEFSSRIVALLTSDREYLEERQKAARFGAGARFSWKRIVKQWMTLFETGELPG